MGLKSDFYKYIFEFMKATFCFFCHYAGSKLIYHWLTKFKKKNICRELCSKKIINHYCLYILYIENCIVYNVCISATIGKYNIGAPKIRNNFWSHQIVKFFNIAIARASIRLRKTWCYCLQEREIATTIANSIIGRVITFLIVQSRKEERYWQKKWNKEIKSNNR